MTMVRRLAVICAALFLLALVASSQIQGEPVAKKLQQLPTAAPVPRPGLEAKNPEANEEALQSRFALAPIFTYKPLQGDLQFALQVKPKLPEVKVRPRDFLVMVSVSANQAGPGFIASNQIVQALCQVAGENDRISLWAAGDPSKKVTRCLTKGFLDIVDYQDAIKKKLDAKSYPAEAKKLHGALIELQTKDFPAGDADLKTALHNAIETFDDGEKNRQRILLFLGDGWSTHNPILGVDRAELCAKMVERRVAFFPVPLGMHLSPENLHGLASGTGGAVLRVELSKDKATEAVDRFNEAFAAPILYDARVQFPAEVTEAFPTRLPPLRSDVPTLVVGRLKAAKSIRYVVTGQVEGGAAVDGLAISEIVPEPEVDNYFLNQMIDQWQKAKVQPALLRADRALALAYHQTKLHVDDLLVGGQLAAEKNELAAAVRLFEQAKQLAPHDQEALAGLKVVKGLQDGRITRDMLRDQFKKDKGDKLEKVNGALRWNKGQLLHLAQLNDVDPPAPKKGVGPVEGRNDLLQAHRDRIIIEEQKMKETVETSLRQARRDLATNPKASLDLLTNTLANVRDHPDMTDATRAALSARLETALRDVATQGRTIELRRQEQQKNLAVLQNELEKQAQRKPLEERIEAQFRVFKGLMTLARYEEKTKNDVINGLLQMEDEARLKGNPIPVVAKAAYDQVLASYNLQKHADLRRLREQRFLAVFLEVEKSHIPFPDEPPIHYPPLVMWKAIEKLRKEKYEVSSLPDDDKGRIEANSIAKLLAETIEMKDFENPMTLKEALGLFYEKFAAKGKELPILVDTDAFKEENPEAPDIYDTQVKFPTYPKRMTMATALRLALAKIPTNNATYLIRRNFIEITTIDRQTREKVLRVYPVGDLVIPIAGGFMGGFLGGGGGGFSMAGGFPGGMGGMAGMPGMGGMGGMPGMMGGMGGMPGMMGGMGGMPGMGGMGGFPGGMGGFPGGMGGMGGMPGMGGMGGFPGGMGGMGGMPGMAGMAGMPGMMGGMAGMGGGFPGQPGFNGNLGVMGASQSNQLIQIITEIVAPGEWFVSPQQPQGGGFLAMMGGVMGFPGGMMGMMGMGVAPPPPPVAQGGPVDITQANTIQFFAPALSLIVRAPSRMHTSISGGIIGGKQMRKDMINRLEEKEKAQFAKADPKNPKINDPQLAKVDPKDLPKVNPNDPKQQFAKVEPAKLPAKDLDPAKVWNEAFAKEGVQPGMVVATADFLFETGNFQHAAEFLKANLRHGVVVRPWVYEALAVALEASQGDAEEIRRARLSAVALDPSDAQGFLQAARTMAENKHWDRALAFCRQAALLEPAAAQPFADALAYAELNKDAKAMEWAVGKILSQDWPVDNGWLHKQAEVRLHTLAQTLDKEQRKTDSDKLRAALKELKQRDLVVELTWQVATGRPAQLDLEVKEPCGSVCSGKQTQTPGGGTLITNNLTEMTRTSYLAAEAFPGDYEITVRRLWGQPELNQARLEIIQNYGTSKESRKLQIVRLDGNTTVKLKLAAGRRVTLASVAPPSLQKREQKKVDELPQSTPGGILSKLRELAYPDFTGIAAGPRGGASTPGASASMPVISEAEKSMYQSPVAPVSGSSTNLTAQMRLSPDRKEMELVMRPFFQTAGSALQRAAPPLSVVPGAP